MMLVTASNWSLATANGALAANYTDGVYTVHYSFTSVPSGTTPDTIHTLWTYPEKLVVT